MVNELRKKFKCFEDPNFKFEPKWHKYTYNGKQYTSVTKFISSFHKEFDQEYWSKRKSEELDIDQEVLLKQWKDKNDYANLVGHTTHDWIESYFNKSYKELPTNLDIIDRINKFNKIYASHLFKLEPVQFELRVFSKKYPIAGTIFFAFWNFIKAALVREPKNIVSLPNDPAPDVATKKPFVLRYCCSSFTSG